MPTYTFRCGVCGRTDDHLIPIGEYIRNRPTFFCCCQPMERAITVAPGLATSNPLAGDRHYDGMRAPDGSDISSRTKHREYMKRTGMTTVDDFSSTWAKQAAERSERLAGADASRTGDVAQAITSLGG